MLGGPIARPNRILRRYLFGILIAVEMLLSFSFFGYFHIEPISITVAYIPVLLAGALLGPGESTAIGAIFGLASMWKASAAYVMPADQLFSPLYSGSPFGSLMLSVGSRTLFALAVGLLYQLARRLRFPLVWVTLVSYLGRTIHSFFVYTAMAVFFPEQGYQPLKAFAGLAEPADIAADLITAAIVLVFCVVARSQPWQQFQHRLELSRTLTGGERRSRFSLILLLSSVFTIVSATAVTFYFTNRIDFVLEGLGVQLSDAGYNDVLHLQIQFLLGIVSLLILMVFLLLLYRQYSAYSAYEAKLDAITGVMTRRAFFTACSRALQTMEDTGLLGYFIMVDLDRFKEINDSYGHPQGDRALQEAAQILKEIFREDCLIGRVGGDEFALLVCAPIPQAELEVDLRRFFGRAHKVVWEDHRLTCSVGVLRFQVKRPAEELYLEADKLLYQAKEKGRDQYVIGRL